MFFIIFANSSMEQQILRGGRYIFLSTGLFYGFFNSHLKQYSADAEHKKHVYIHRVEEIKAALQEDVKSAH